MLRARHSVVYRRTHARLLFRSKGKSLPFSIFIIAQVSMPFQCAYCTKIFYKFYAQSIEPACRIDAAFPSSLLFASTPKARFTAVACCRRSISISISMQYRKMRWHATAFRGIFLQKRDTFKCLFIIFFLRLCRKSAQISRDKRPSIFEQKSLDLVSVGVQVYGRARERR